ncbi:MAG: GldG family protein [Gammaproteobacteria bacterium]|nr:GldG family protein [Gammaproteobacteria bacterium]
MKLDRHALVQLKIQNIIFLVLFLTVIGLLAWLSKTYNYEMDWTANKRNTLSEASIKLLSRMQEPLKITAFATESELVPARKKIKELIGRYQRHKSDINLRFINPETEPELTRSQGITIDGELIVEYQSRSEHVQNVSEEVLTNTLQRLMRSSEQNIVFVTGHGERAPAGQANHDYGLFMKHLADKGIKAITLSLNENPSIPADTSVLVIAGPQIDYLPGEVNLINEYISKGGNLLWLHDPGALYGLQPVADKLGISFVEGMIVDPTTQVLGIADPSFALITEYAEHPVSNDFTFMTIYPRAAGITHTENTAWQAQAFLTTVERSWSETELKGVVTYDEGRDTAGPLTIGLALTPVADHETEDTKNTQDTKDKKETKERTDKQRIIILGDGDFLSNAYLGNQGNKDMGYNIMNWLSHDDQFISIPSTTAPDTELTLEEMTWSILGILILVVLPLLLLASGIVIWLRRRKK